ncbi:triose-phosphate isomerase [Fodinibius salsisoli]|uniref:Triosephosphate isomerase n=1 Tax=Fodinibius salsisoli TaxID=2820877 RepID=A0ABT3PNF5_9BACT|nr:triose-phosphate isomerase [Fodinibius salsisoli]MCW9707184.1 triose-phosphate isomerase [Fodinibius salsisoli]
MRNFLIAGNWKMNCGPQETSDLLQGIKNSDVKIPDSIDVLVCPPMISLTTASAELEDQEDISLGAQNVYSEDNGSYTGEVSTQMLNEVGCTYVILGHSERREYFGETDKTVNAKAKKAVSDNLRPVICVGESLKQRKADEHELVVRKQVEAAILDIDADDAMDLVIAYEPIWAIGTGESATPEQAQEMHKMIREVLADVYSQDKAGQIQVLYGGSMKPHNAEELLSQPDVDGGLIGGASLKADSFTAIIEIADQLSS